VSNVKPEDFLIDLLEKEREQNKKLSWHLIHTKAKWIKKGESRERYRIVKLLQPHAEHEDWCEDGGCYPEDCSAPVVQYLIRKILETDLQENVNNDGQKEA
jgi:hypothetical protein